MLAAVCMFGAVPYTSLSVNASDSTGIETEDKGILETEQSPGTERADTEEIEKYTRRFPLGSQGNPKHPPNKLRRKTNDWEAIPPRRQR